MNSLLILITVVSIAFAAAMTAVAWRSLSRERRRSTARVAALAAEIGDDGWPPPQPVRAAAVNMFSGGEEAAAHSPMPVALAAGAVIVGTIIVLALLPREVRGSRVSALSAGSSAASSTGVERQAAPIELVALGHERNADRLTVHGIVRNPPNGLDVPHLSAVVLLFDSAGEAISSERAVVETDDLLPGTETRFTVSIADAADIGRYRVSFRTGEHIVPHVDKRDGA